MIPPTYMLMQRSKPLAAAVATDVARPQPPVEMPDVASGRAGLETWVVLAVLAGLSAYVGVIDLLR